MSVHEKEGLEAKRAAARGREARVLHDARATGRWTLDPALPLQVGLSAAFAGSVGCARAHVDECPRDSVRAVHDYRRAIRRARSLVRLARPLVSSGAFRALDDDLRAALGVTSSLRDASVLLGTLESFEEEDGLEQSKAALGAVLRAQAGAVHEPGRALAELRRGEQLLEPLPAALLRALPHDVGWKDVRKAIERSYRRARRARKRARESGADADVHAFRKRVKELRYQLEILDAKGAGRPRGAHRRLAALADDLGEVTDRVVLRRWLRSRGEALCPSEAGRLAEAIGRRNRKRFRAIYNQSSKVFDERPAIFAARAIRRLRVIGG